MSRFRPETKSNGPKPWLGFKETAVVGFNDKTEQFDWADVYLEVEFLVKDSKYPQRHSIAGSFDKEANGTIKSCSLLNRLYYLFDAIGFEGGPNTQGEFEDQNETLIGTGSTADLVEYLNKNYRPTKGNENLNLYVYIYEEAPKKPGAKSYTRVAYKIAKNNDKGRKDLEDYIVFMKSKKYIKEVDESSPSSFTVKNDKGDDLF